MGDCLHQRAILRQLMRDHDVFLETSWGSMYHDLVAEGLTLIYRRTSLCTQEKNAQRELHLMHKSRQQFDRQIHVSYPGSAVIATKSKTVLEAMCNVTSTDYATADYRLPIPDVWSEEMNSHFGIGMWNTKPLCIYRPLVSRREFRGSELRNADPAGYTRLFQTIRDTFFVISIADLEPSGPDQLVGPQLRADITLHHGELSFEALAALFSIAKLVYTSSGFPAILGPAVGTPTISIVGGYEMVGCHDSGAKFAPYLAIGPRGRECSCWTSACRTPCDKRIDTDVAFDRIRDFMSRIGIQIQDNTTGFGDMFAMPLPPNLLPRLGLRA